MRYIIETGTLGLIEDFVKGRTDVKVLDKYDPVEKLTARVEKMRLAFESFKSNRGSWKILVGYLRSKGIAKHEIHRVLDGMEEFLKELEQ